MAVPILAVSIQPGSRLKSEGNILIHLYNWQTSNLIRVIDMGLSSDASEVCMAFSPHGRLELNWLCMFIRTVAVHAYMFLPYVISL
jgi:hypothetical protein